MLATGAILLNAYLLKTGRFGPMPRPLANGLTVLAAAFAAWRLAGTAYPVTVVAEFLVVLQVVKLYERRAARDEAQLLVLSLLLMVASAISTDSLLFGLLLIAYLFLALYCCLLFHLKVEADAAKRAMGLRDWRDDRVHPVTLRQDQRHFPRSMRRITAVVSAISVATAVVVFLAFPRGAGAGFLGPMRPFRADQTLVGLSESVDFQDIAKIQQNTAKAGYVAVFDPRRRAADRRPAHLPARQRFGPVRRRPRQPDRLAVAAELRRRPGAARAHRARRGPAVVRRLRRADLAAGDHPRTHRHAHHCRGFRASSRSGRPDRSPSPTAGPTPCSAPGSRCSSGSTTSFGAPTSCRACPRPGRRASPTKSIPRSARSPCGPRSAGPSPRRTAGTTSLAAQRLALGESARTPLDAAVARNVERFLQREFAYTLDLTPERWRFDGRDPIEVFLYDLKKGHCEYFAGAMALMCQSLGMDARVVVGFRVDEFNATTETYIIRQSHAHAWVEVRTEAGWQRFDPTSGNEAMPADETTAWQRLKHLVDYFEYTWAENVVAYDGAARDNLVQNVDVSLQNSAIRSSELFGRRPPVARGPAGIDRRGRPDRGHRRHDPGPRRGRRLVRAGAVAAAAAGPADRPGRPARPTPSAGSPDSSRSTTICCGCWSATADAGPTTSRPASSPPPSPPCPSPPTTPSAA